MSYLQRKMFANGGGVSVAPNQVIIGNETFTLDLNKFEQAVREGLLDGMSLYPILNAPGAQRGSEIQRILNEFARVDEPGIYPNRIAANIMGVAPEDRPDSFLYEPGDFGSAAQDVGLELQRYGQSVRNVAADAGNLAARGLRGIFNNPDIAEAFGGMKGREKAIKRQAEGGGLIPEGDIFSKVPLMTQDDVAKIRLRQMGNIVSLSDTIDQDIEKITEEKSPVFDPLFVKEMPKGIVEIINIGPDEDIDSILEKIKPIDVNKTEQESVDDVEKKFDGLPDSELKDLLDPIKPILSIPEAAAETQEKQEAQEEQEDDQPPPPKTDPAPPPKTKGDGLIKDTDGDPVSRKLDEPGFFGSDLFLNFIRNVGGELVRTGQMGPGLASGAAKAAEERAARELLADQERRKYEREIELARAKADATVAKPMSTEKIIELNEKMIKDMNEFKGGVAATGFVDLAIQTIKEAKASGESVGGALGLVNSLFDKVGAFFGTDAGFEGLSAQEKVNKLVEVVRQKNLQAILGESGRTISDRDRTIILEVFGDLSVFQDADVTLGKLEESRRGLADNNESRKRVIQTTLPILGQQGTYGQQFFVNLLPIYGEIQGIDPQASQAAAVLQRFLGQSVQSGIEEISL